MVGALVLRKTYVSLQNKGLSCGIFDNNYDLVECALVEVVQITDASYRLRSTPLQRLFPGLRSLPARLFASKKPLARCSLPFHLAYLHGFALWVVRWWKILSKINFAGFFESLARPPCAPGCQWRVLTTRGSS